MAAILNIETATPLCSVALAIDGRLITQRETQEEKSHAARLTVYIEEQGLQIKDLHAIAIGKGPGSYTGLRIGVSTAKGLCYGAGIPLIAVSTLRIMVNYAQEICRERSIPLDENVLLCPMIDARRMEVFSCIYMASGKEKEPISAKIIDAVTYASYLQTSKIYFFGSGMPVFWMKFIRMLLHWLPCLKKNTRKSNSKIWHILNPSTLRNSLPQYLKKACLFNKNTVKTLFSMEKAE